jgi:hypothetical protein
MKTIILTIATFLTLNLSAQNMTPVTRAEVNEINLRLDNLDRFGRQHRTGNHLMIAGTLLSGIGSWILATNSPSKYNNQYTYGNNSAKAAYQMYKRTNRIGFTVLGIGSGLATTGLIVNIDSFRHLRNDK